MIDSIDRGLVKHRRLLVSSMHEITADLTTLMQQSSYSAAHWFNEALKVIDAERGEKLPLGERLRLAVDLAKVAAMDFQATSITLAAQIRSEG
jgi:hypothetical protein